MICVILSNLVNIRNLKGLFNVARIAERHEVKIKLMTVDITDISVQVTTKSLFSTLAQFSACVQLYL